MWSQFRIFSALARKSFGKTGTIDNAGVAKLAPL